MRIHPMVIRQSFSFSLILIDNLFLCIHIFYIFIFSSYSFSSPNSSLLFLTSQPTQFDLSLFLSPSSPPKLSKYKMRIKTNTKYSIGQNGKIRQNGKRRPPYPHTQNVVYFVMSHYSRAWGMHWNAVDIKSDITFKKTGFPFPRRCHLQIASSLGVGVHDHFSSSVLEPG